MPCAVCYVCTDHILRSFTSNFAGSGVFLAHARSKVRLYPSASAQKRMTVSSVYACARRVDTTVHAVPQSGGCAQATAEGEPPPVVHVPSTPDNADACEKRPWECQYCALKCTYGEGEEKHWPACLKFPEPCPNSCEVGSVERCNMEQHRSVCSLEPVACEMKEFGCSVVVPRKELATHMRESELQHLTAMTVLNLRLSRQLQQDSTERDRKITQLQQEMADMKKLQTEMKTKFGEQKQLLNEHTRELTELKGQVQKVQHTTDHIEQHTACTACEVITFAMYSKNKRDGKMMWSDLYILFSLSWLHVQNGN